MREVLRVKHYALRTEEARMPSLYYLYVNCEIGYLLGTMKKYDIISDYGRFECEPGVQIAVDCVSSGQADLDEKNVRIIESKWKDVWPSFAFLKELRKKYDFDTNFTPPGMRAKLMLGDTVMSDDARWEVSFTIVDDGYSEWGVAYKGSTIDPHSSQPYF